MTLQEKLFLAGLFLVFPVILTPIKCSICHFIFSERASIVNKLLPVLANPWNDNFNLAISGGLKPPLFPTI